MEKKIAILGGGNLGGSLVQGLVRSNKIDPELICVTGRSMPRLNRLKDLGVKLSQDNKKAVQDCAVIILAVQPSQMVNVLEEINPVLSKDQIIVSTATGVSSEDIRGKLSFDQPVIRSMPNTASAIGQSITCLSSNNAGDKDWAIIEELFGYIGKTLRIEEELMQAATVLGASGIAFFLRYIRAATQGGIQMGFHPADAQLIAMQTAIGAASLVFEKNRHPEMEIDKVTTPRGCTIEGLNEMEHQGLSSAVIKGLMASYEKINTILT